MTHEFVLALDQGTTSSRAILFTRDGRPAGQRHQEHPQIYPRPGWVEHSPQAIWDSQRSVARQLLADLGVDPGAVAAIGITNQRETALVWDRATGAPIDNAIVWQCRRTAADCEALKARGWSDRIRRRTGLVIDAYFSATKVKWLLDHHPGLRARAERGEVLFGTVDSWLIWQLTGGRVHATDVSNAARTMLFNIHTLDWDDEILRELAIPRAMLPAVLPSSHLYGETDPAILGTAIPIAGVAGDQQAALFGQTCFRPGEAKNTYGTGSFLLLQTGSRAVDAGNGLLTTIAWGLDGGVQYALEGSIFITGAAVQWLRDELRLIESAAASETLAASVPDTAGVYVVPAFVGLGAPYWDAYARGTIVGLTRGAGRAHIVRATLEAIAYQTRDVLAAMQTAAGIGLQSLRVDGGAVANNFLMQFQADILGVPVVRPAVIETTALGAAYLAGLATGFWSHRDEVAAGAAVEAVFQPRLTAADRDRLYAGWQRAVERSRAWAQED